MYRFLVTASILVLLGFVYLGQRLIAEIWGKNLQLALWLILGAMIANLLWLPFKRWRRQMAARPNPQNETVARYLEASAYNLMGLLSLLLLFSVLSDVLRLVFAFYRRGCRVTFWSQYLQARISIQFSRLP